MKKQLYYTPVIECVQVESTALMNVGSPTILTTGGSTSGLGGATPIAD